MLLLSHSVRTEPRLRDWLAQGHLAINGTGKFEPTDQKLNLLATTSGCLHKQSDRRVRHGLFSVTPTRSELPVWPRTGVSPSRRAASPW